MAGRCEEQARDSNRSLRARGQPPATPLGVRRTESVRPTGNECASGKVESDPAFPDAHSFPVGRTDSLRLTPGGVAGGWPRARSDRLESLACSSHRPAMRFTVATYNIHKGFSQLNRRMVIHELRDRLAGLDADILFLQEVVGVHERHAARHYDWPAKPQHEFIADTVWQIG